jgi:hypothetical protein
LDEHRLMRQALRVKARETTGYGGYGGRNSKIGRVGRRWAFGG